MAKHEVWNLGRGIILLPVAGHPNPIQLYPGKQLTTSGKRILKAASEYGCPLEVVPPFEVEETGVVTDS